MNDSQHSDCVIIGGVAAGPKCAATLARRRPGATITLFQKEELLSYGTCGLPFFASGDISSLEELLITSYGVARDADFFAKAKSFTAITAAEITTIDREKKTITGRMIHTGETFTHGYDKLVITTGANPTPPPFPVADCPNVRTFTRPADAAYFRRQAEQGKIGKAVVIGGGLIGCEVIQSCADLWGIETTLIEIKNHVLPYVLDDEMAEIVEREIIRHDVKLASGVGVEKIETDGDGNPVVYVTGREPISADYVFLCLGVRPNITLAQSCGLAIGQTGAIEVNEFMQTSDPDIYAGGDCIETVNQLTGRKMYIPMGSMANRHGRVIAEHIAGCARPFPGALGAFLVKVFDLHVGAVGLSEIVANQTGLKTRAAWGSFPDKPDYYPEYKTFSAKMVYDTADGQLLGLQAVGSGDICRRIDAFSTHLHFKSTVDQLLDFEHGYAPPFSEALDPLHHLAGIAKAQRAGFVFANIDHAVKQFGDAFWLDVRETDEVEGQPIPSVAGTDSINALNIPLKEIKDRVSQLDKTRKIVIICKRGVRSYQAAHILKNAGFTDVVIVGGGVQTMQ
ncbi:MAG: FAD-dependent oxidoreductase [candidate division Zixibacteria bacterium]|nr:FAD-dependent oxidoreductase [candidate division Zixibacteria bacterium]